jgi:hypothetical protein
VSREVIGIAQRECPVCDGARHVRMAPVGAPELPARTQCPMCGPARRPLVLHSSLIDNRVIVLEAT